MKRAEVYKDREDRVWVAETWGGGLFPDRDDFPTHEAALAHALAEVGFTETNTEKGKDR